MVNCFVNTMNYNSQRETKKLTHRLISTEYLRNSIIIYRSIIAWINFNTNKKQNDVFASVTLNLLSNTKHCIRSAISNLFIYSLWTNFTEVYWFNLKKISQNRLVITILCGSWLNFYHVAVLLLEYAWNIHLNG